ncbi:3-oxoacyl-[acyl-carrier protein] reductase [Gracilibacillus orientalis]|uniref:3-oxoacyl-[acyl-carrier protein] reductase n=1 Tax=Gracilibacillus orientalis TaxID=334253 RepID=A0A1I4P9A0_9BACI|nr:SDR family oxidoreductase [Gracilibacillus orientalis]SFM24146.1 3-oxoacyl-[acyl-carrier protein] reductase [Gracilibacillus orientalis]
MDLGVKGKKVLVTAASKGLGKACAKAYAEEGAQVFIASRNKAQLDRAANEIIEQTGNANVEAIVCDLTKSQDIENMMQSIGRVDILINNAGGPPAGKFNDFDDADWQHAFELLLMNIIRTVRAVTPAMREQQFGRIVNITSSSMKQALDGLLLSNTFRPAIVGLSKSLSQELASDQILINSVGPGTMETDRIRDIYKQQPSDESVEERLNKAGTNIPIGRIGQPEEFAKAILFLGSAANTYITGQTLIVDGGAMKTL